MNKKALLIVGLMLFFAAAYFYQDPEWNGNSRLDLTRAIVERVTLRVDAYQNAPGWATEDSAYYNGHYYSDKAPGSSFLAVPPYFLLYHLAALLKLQLGSDFIKHFLTTTVLGLSFALAGISMYRVAARLGAPPRLTLVATAAVAFGTMLWPYSAVYYGHVIAAAFLIVAFDVLLSARVAAENMTMGKFFAFGILLGFGFITEYTTALIIAGLLGYAAYVVKGRKSWTVAGLALAALLGALIPLSITLAYNAAIYGNPLTLGYAHESSDTFNEGMAAGLMGIYLPRRSVLYHITLDPKFGLFWQSPVLLLAPVGYIATLMGRRYRAEALLSAYAVSAMLLMNAGYYLWWGGHAFGPRFIIPALPFFVVPLALVPDFLEAPMMFLGAVSIGQMLIPLMGAVQPAVDFKQRFNSFFVDGRRFNGFSILYDRGLPLIAKQLHEGMPSWTLAAAARLPYWLTIPVLLAAESALVFLHGRLTGYVKLPDSQPEAGEPPEPPEVNSAQSFDGE